MTCNQYRDTIAEFIDGALEPAARQNLERHVESCAACRALIADLKSIQAAAFTLDRLDVPAHLLPAVRARIGEERQSASARTLAALPASRAAFTAWLAAAAALLLVTSAGLWHLTRSFDAPAGTPTQTSALQADEAVASVQAELRAATEHYERAIRQLEEIAQRGDGTLDPQIATVFETNLEVIDQAIDDNRTALQTQPASADAQEGLFDAMRSKVALLQQTVELINEMRKGNQAEAGRIIQGLNQ